MLTLKANMGNIVADGLRRETNILLGNDLMSAALPNHNSEPAMDIIETKEVPTSATEKTVREMKKEIEIAEWKEKIRFLRAQIEIIKEIDTAGDRLTGELEAKIRLLKEKLILFKNAGEDVLKEAEKELKETWEDAVNTFKAFFRKFFHKEEWHKKRRKYN